MFGAVVLLQIDEHTHEQGVNAHRKHIKEELAYAEGADHHGHHGQQIIVELGHLVRGKRVHWNLAREEEVARHANDARDGQVGQEEDKVTDIVHNDDAEHIGADQTERLARGTAKVQAVYGGQDKGVAIEEL